MAAFAAVIAVAAAGMAAPGRASAAGVGEAREAFDAARAASDEAAAAYEEAAAREAEAASRLDAGRAAAAAAIRAAYKGGGAGMAAGGVASLLSAGSVSDLVRRMSAVSEFDGRAADAVASLAAARAEAEGARGEAEARRGEADAAREEALGRLEEAEEAARRAEAAARAAAPGPSSRPNGSGLTKAGGVNYHNGHRETYYSSRVLYHYMTPQWHLDEEGFWRTPEGYYVVAANSAEYPKGTLIQQSKGTCQVLDSGCAYGTIDFYVNW